MDSDTYGEGASNYKSENDLLIATNLASQEKAERLFNTLSASGQVGMPQRNPFWEEYFGMFSDKQERNWMIGYKINSTKNN